MERQTFILVKTKPFRHHLKLFLKDIEGKVDRRIVTFTTEHKVNEKERTKNARKIPAEFSTSDENVIDALYRDTGYGKTFVHKDDTKGARKEEPFKITPIDTKKIALQNLFKAANLDFDPTKSVEVLNEEYRIHVTAKAGVSIGQSTAPKIIHEPIDVQKSISDQAEIARNVYKEKYGEEVPESHTNDLTFLSALADPNFDAKKYIEGETATSEEIDDDFPEDVESLRKMYFDTFGQNPANPKKNDAAWMAQKIKGKLAQK